MLEDGSGICTSSEYGEDAFDKYKLYFTVSPQKLQFVNSKRQEVADDKSKQPSIKRDLVIMNTAEYPVNISGIVLNLKIILIHILASDVLVKFYNIERSMCIVFIQH